jgi:drug/metabolite transporter (DMT)-like permease
MNPVGSVNQAQSKRGIGSNYKRSLLILLAFSAIYFIWGTTYMAVIFALKSFPPFLLSAFRFGVSGILLFIYCLIRGERLPAAISLKVLLVSGVLMLVGGSGLVTWSEQYVLSGHAAVVTATEPFIFLLFDRSRWQFYFSQRLIILGLIVGFIGVVAFILYAPQNVNLQVPKILMVAGYAVLFVSCMLWVIGSLYASNFNPDKKASNAMTASIQLLGAALVSTLLGVVMKEHQQFSFYSITPSALGGLLYLTFMGSIIAFVAFMWLLSVKTPAQVSTHTYVNPVVAVFMGWWILNEPVNGIQLIAIAIILLGVLLTNMKKNEEVKLST